MSEALAAYNNLFDVENYTMSDPLDLEKKQRLNSYTRRQVETHIGERFNALLSITNYELRDGIIYGQNMDEPFMDSIVRGRNFRRIHGNPIDWPREAAEVFGFPKTQKLMAEANEGEMVAVVSKPGKINLQTGEQSIYQHNFIDIYTKKRDEKGVYIEARRYSTALTGEEYIDFARSQRQNVPDDADDAFFLENPFQIRTFETAEEVHRFLHKEHTYITEEELSEILSACAPLIIAYINALASGELDLQRFTFNAVLNRADDKYLEMKKGERVVYEEGLSRDQIIALGQREVREVLTGCGSSGGFNMSKDGKLAPFSVSEFARDYPFDKFGICHKCKGETMLGPCGICEPCDDGIRAEQKSLLN